MAEGTTKQERKVEYVLEEVDVLPPEPVRITRVQPYLDRIKEATDAGTRDPKKWVVVAKYSAAPAASGSARNLRNKLGPPEANGWEFTSRKLEGGKSGLFIRYDPSKIVPGEAEKAQAAYEVQTRASREKAKAQKAAKARKAS